MRTAGSGPLTATLALMLVLAGCGNATAWLAGEPPPQEVEPMSGAKQGQPGRGSWSGEISQVQSQTFLVARTQEEWEQVWGMAGQPVPGPLPPRLMALGLFLGARSSGGHGVDVVKLAVERAAGQRDTLVVEYKETKPDGPAAMVITAPWTIVLVDRTDAAIRYVRAP